MDERACFLTVIYGAEFVEVLFDGKIVRQHLLSELGTFAWRKEDRVLEFVRMNDGQLVQIVETIEDEPVLPKRIADAKRRTYAEFS